ncbi:TetR/AcrR family transcriptional regulator [Aeromicrobium piscarium]|uniref:TetR/AcrR family transcriptional regulator n=1 Tax=Aeromicrobium piscarium TaxID=2590901 RepID=A0A554SPN5_9ACTN|nr:TetR family transcriptional regulator [Aeromicrobium piscarium]TSD68312.1 TetR/AcrR family transcriptional regulator [Aeromicrobium piscarium]
MARARLSQERSRQRREQLLDAAVRVYAFGGIRAVTHRAVASEAQLPTAATTYYFASITELVREAFRRHITGWTASLENVDLHDLDLSFLADVDDTTRAIIPTFAEHDRTMWGLDLALFLQASRDQELRPEISEAVRLINQRLTGLLTEHGLEQPDELAAALISQMVGTAIRLQSHDDDAVEAHNLATSLRYLLAAHLAGPESVDEACRWISGRSAESP